jgi:arsenate reductase-like glutaredoxin family protein
LLKQGARLELRDLDKERMTEAELDALIGTRDYKSFLNPRNQLYREREMNSHPPSRAQAIKLMAQVPNLIRRPVVIRGSQIVLGFDEAGLKKIAE